MAALCIVLALFGALDGIRGHAVVQQASASLCKGVHPYNSPALNKTQGIAMGFHAPTQLINRFEVSIQQISNFIIINNIQSTEEFTFW